MNIEQIHISISEMKTVVASCFCLKNTDGIQEVCTEDLREKTDAAVWFGRSCGGILAQGVVALRLFLPASHFVCASTARLGS